ncbi:hypothetical protein OSB04_un001462 [Centaurea solstitialis]|uniref:Uncharacterized protein n=1 Tax=Centaurea solstitialis TaxID=347529 RepID=A0AA38SFK9_9ASTR|nr:hypothetical protein OSB04_un001462 [Centaurea solstitialis]
MPYSRKSSNDLQQRVPVPETDTGGAGRSRKLVTDDRGAGDRSPVNGGRNYNGPKVAKFLVGHVCEDADYLHLDRKDPMKLHCFLGLALAFPAQLRWKARRPPSGGVSSGRTEIGPRVAKAEGSLTARPTRRAGTKVGLSDPTVPSGRAVAQRIKVTLGITGDLPQELTSTEGLAPRCRLFAPGAVVCSKGWAVRPLKRYVSWVSERRETVWSISGVGVRALRGPFPSTRGPGRTHLVYPLSCPRACGSTAETATGSCPCGDGATEVLRIQEKVTARRAVYITIGVKWKCSDVCS